MVAVTAGGPATEDADMQAPWFEIDRGGLAKVVARRGKAYVVAELCQNSWDAPGVRRVDIHVEPVEGRPLARLRVVDDSPEGFADLAHSFTLFAESSKKTDPSLRGRFNLGEKLVLSLCQEATIASTRGTVTFDDDGRRINARRRRESGTEFSALLRMTRAEAAEAVEAVRGFIPPEGIETFVNGERIPAREPLAETEWTLTTEVADTEGVLRRVKRKAPVRVFEPAPGSPGRLYELGIPVMETGDRYDVDVGQKVPLSLERDAVSPAYLRDVRVCVLNVTGNLLGAEEAASAWVSDAMGDKDVAPEAVGAVIRARYGDRAVAYDPSDKEANNRAVNLGYTVVTGGAMTRDQWANVRAAGVLAPAGRVTPTPRPFSEHGEPARHAQRSPAMRRFEAFCHVMAERLLGRPVHVNFFEDFNADAAYAPGLLCFNVGKLGGDWFEGPLGPHHVNLLIHEFGHEYSPNHLDRAYLDGLTSLGAKATMLALSEPGLFTLAPSDGARG